MGREDEGSDLWEWETPRGLFLCVGRGNLGTFPCLTDEACSPTNSAKVNWVFGALIRHEITPDMVLSRVF